MESSAAGGAFSCPGKRSASFINETSVTSKLGTDERWDKPHQRFPGAREKVAHGDWRGQTLWRVSAATLQANFDSIVLVIQAAASIFSQEPTVVQLQQPCHVFGDIHGNFSDLKYFESLLWPLGVAFTAGTFLWLGDYVDRGTSSAITPSQRLPPHIMAGAAGVETIL
jgi:hypothetical protein